MSRRERRQRRAPLGEPFPLPPEVAAQLRASGLVARIGHVQIGGNTKDMVEVTCIRCGLTGRMPADDAPGVGAMCLPCVADVIEGA